MIIKRLHRQHSSTVLIVPKLVLSALEIGPGDYIGLDILDADKEVVITKIIHRGKRNGESRENQNQCDKSGRT